MWCPRRVFYSQRYILPLDHRDRTVKTLKACYGEKIQVGGKIREKLFRNKNDMTNDESLRTLSIYIYLLCLFCSFVATVNIHHILNHYSIALRFFDGLFSAIFIAFRHLLYFISLSLSMHVLYNCCPTFSYPAFTFLFFASMVNVPERWGKGGSD